MQALRVSRLLICFRQLQTLACLPSCVHRVFNFGSFYPASLWPLCSPLRAVLYHVSYPSGCLFQGYIVAEVCPPCRFKAARLAVWRVADGYFCAAEVCMPCNHAHHEERTATALFGTEPSWRRQRCQWAREQHPLPADNPSYERYTARRPR